MKDMTTNPNKAHTSDVAELLGVSAATVARYARTNRIPFTTTPGGHRRFDLSEVRTAIGSDRRVNLTAVAVDPGRTHIGTGPSLSMSAAHAFERQLRGVETVPSTTAPATSAPRLMPRSPSAISELVRNARRILVAAER